MRRTLSPLLLLALLIAAPPPARGQSDVPERALNPLRSVEQRDARQERATEPERRRTSRRKTATVLSSGVPPPSVLSASALSASAPSPIARSASTRTARTRTARTVAAELDESVPPPLPQGIIPFSDGTLPENVEMTSHGGRISLKVRDAPLNRVLSLLAQTQDLNIVFSNDIATPVSITLRDVLLEDALTAILSVSGYAWVRHNNIIHVTSIRQSSGLPAEVQGRRMQVFPLDYVSSVDVSAAVQGVLSPVGRVYTGESSPLDNRQTEDYVVVEDLPSVLARVAQFICQIDQPPRQVLIEAHILEVELKDDLQHGVNFKNMFNVNGNSVTIETKGFANPAASQAFFARIDGGNLEALVEALQSTTDAKTLASPRLLVLNGQQARLQVGEQLGFRVTTATETTSLESVEFLDVGVVLTVTPRISRDHRVVLHVRPEVSSGQVNPDTGLPEEETTEVETDVLLHDGQGMVIGGLIQEKDTTIQSKIPILGNAWVVGKMFQRNEVVKSRKEIIVTLVPHLLPFDTETEDRNGEEVCRTETPLVEGPLDRVPRSWDPKLPDANRIGRRPPRRDPRR